MSDDRKNLKISEETYRELKDGKPDGVTWDYYLQNLTTDAVTVQNHPSNGSGHTKITVNGETVALVPGERRTLGEE